MTPDEFSKLPPAVALRALLQAVPSLAQAIASAPLPELPRRPKYDMPIYRKGSIQWASETDLAGLQWWSDRYAQSSDPKYAEKDAKRVQTLARWIAWREVEPGARWVGVRNDDSVTAAPPSDRPRVYRLKNASDVLMAGLPLVAKGEPIEAPPLHKAQGGDDDIPF